MSHDDNSADLLVAPSAVDAGSDPGVVGVQGTRFTAAQMAALRADVSRAPRMTSEQRARLAVLLGPVQLPYPTVLKGRSSVRVDDEPDSRGDRA